MNMIIPNDPVQDLMVPVQEQSDEESQDESEGEGGEVGDLFQD